MDARIVAAHIVNLAAERGDLIDPLKLQKLCYYAQGYSLALRQRLMFDDPIQAWEHGPVVPDVYQAYKQHGRDSIPPSADAPELEQWRRDVIEMVYTRLGWMTSWNLRNQTHMEQPWRDAWRTGEHDAELPVKQMRDFFRKELLGQRVIAKPVSKDAVEEMLRTDVDLQQRVARRRNQPTSRSRF